jgi:O-antigen/teichoic acid export membrane protein
MLSDLGIGMDVVQHRRGDDPVFVNTAFLIQVGRGAVVWAIATTLAYPFAYFYGQPEVYSLAIVGAFSVAVRGMASGSVWLMTRHVQLGKLTALNVSSELAGFLVSVTWAFISPDAWALIAGRLGAAIAFTVGSHVVAQPRVSLRWDGKAARDIFLFGTGIFVSTATYFLGGEAERLVIGKFISIEELGCFSLALTLSAAPARAIQQVVGQVFFPIMARNLRQDRDRATEYFRSAKWVFLAIGVVLGMGFIAYSHRLVMALLPSNYEMTGWMLQLLGFRAGAEVFAAPTSSLILASGHARYAAVGNAARLVLMVTGVWLALSEFGIHQAVAVLAIVPVITYASLIYGVARLFRQTLLLELVTFGLFVAAMSIAAILPWPWT